MFQAPGLLLVLLLLKMTMQHNVIDQSKEVTILEILDRVLNKGVVIVGDVVISVADIDLVYLGVKLLLSSVETMEQKRLTTVKSNT
jgi:gas vesicle structural protein